MPNVHTYLSPRNRNFVVRSMHPETMLRSRAFLERSQLLLLLRKFIEEDEHKTPLHKRDLSWLTDCYYSMGLPQAVSSYLRYNQPIREVLRISTEPRHVRHLAHAHIRGVFAQHAEWLLAVQVATASKNAQMLDIPSWIAFCRDAQEDSLSARNSGYPWGIFHSGAEGAQHARFEKLAARLARFGDTKEEWERRLKNSVKRAHKQKACIVFHYFVSRLTGCYRRSKKAQAQIPTTLTGSPLIQNLPSNSTRTSAKLRQNMIPTTHLNSTSR